jgi:hypothetical protein
MVFGSHVATPSQRAGEIASRLDVAESKPTQPPQIALSRTRIAVEPSVEWSCSIEGFYIAHDVSSTA